MTDRELLELAAKAAGYPPEWHGSIKIETANGARKWSPLEDDGDALRLAVNLGLRVKVEQDAHAEVDSGNDNSPMCWQAAQKGKDIYAATRRAIVRAAAEIGKAMP